jgi:environmental stress-induced protein Ves
MKITHLRESDYRRMRWKNGGGWTTELHNHSAGDGNFGWRISIADIESDGAFSTFPHCTRWIALLEGNGMRLDFGGAAPAAALAQRLRFVEFSGDWQTHGTLIDGPVRDFNLIALRDLWQAEIHHRPLVGSMMFPASGSATWFVHFAAGSGRVQRHDELPEISAGESLLIESDGQAGGIVIDGGGELVVVKLKVVGV